MAEENCGLLAAAFVHSPTKSQRRSSIEFGISRRRVGRITDNLSMKPYRPQFALNEDDNDLRNLAYLEDIPDILVNIIWRDEGCFKFNGNIKRHNCVYWSCVNLHVAMERHL